MRSMGARSIPRLLSLVSRAMAIAQFTQLHISVPVSGMPPGQVPEECFPGGASSRPDRHHWREPGFGATLSPPSLLCYQKQSAGQIPPEIRKDWNTPSPHLINQGDPTRGGYPEETTKTESGTTFLPLAGPPPPYQNSPSTCFMHLLAPKARQTPWLHASTS